MATAAATSWRNAGKPWRLAQPIADLSRILRKYGYTVGTIGNDAHLNARTPEDHTPFSYTGWPGKHPYPFVLALDIMPPPAGRGLPSLAVLGAQIVADRASGYGPAKWIKYINWTNGAGAVRHERWTPNHTVKASNDRGHIHISGRTDFVSSSVAQEYDPVARAIHMIAPAPSTGAAKAPPFPGRTLTQPPIMRGEDVRTWQRRMQVRGWVISADGEYGPQSEDVCRRFQRDKGLQVDGEVGPITWRVSWEAAIT